MSSLIFISLTLSLLAAGFCLSYLLTTLPALRKANDLRQVNRELVQDYSAICESHTSALNRLEFAKVMLTELQANDARQSVVIRSQKQTIEMYQKGILRPINECKNLTYVE